MYNARAVNILKHLKIKSVDDLVVYSRADLLAQPNSGKKTVRFIEEALETWGFRLR